MKVGVAYIEEPLFYWTGSDNRATGADIELADVTLRAIGASDVEFVQTTFEELLAGVQEGRCSLCARRIDRHRGGRRPIPAQRTGYSDRCAIPVLIFRRRTYAPIRRGKARRCRVTPRARCLCRDAIMSRSRLVLSAQA